ncbi:hypothetical protein ATN79_05595 [Paraburkholderia caribensis]|nr:hypothetical protein ATN79_05595 [Paraburkholderia caribensis]
MFLAQPSRQAAASRRNTASLAITFRMASHDSKPFLFVASGSRRITAEFSTESVDKPVGNLGRICSSY